MVYFSLGPITFDFGLLISFFIGVSFGITLFILVYLYAVIRSINRKQYLYGADETRIDAQEIQEIVEQAITDFKDKTLRAEPGTIKHTANLSSQLTKDIAKKFYPHSKYPLLELSIDETLLLGGYITKRIDEIFEHRLLRIFRKRTIAELMRLRDVKKAVDNNPIVKTSKKLHVAQVFKTAVGALNIVNPVYWSRRILVNQAIDIAVKKMCVAFIGIVGEETYKIYSKRVFNEELSIDAGINLLYQDIQDELNAALLDLSKHDKEIEHFGEGGELGVKTKTTKKTQRSKSD